jgi:hypothetical protein
MKEWLTWNMYNVFEWSDMSICKLLVLYKVDTIPSKYNLFSPWYSQVRVITVFTVFRLLTDFVCLYNYELWLSLCKIARNSVILLLPLFDNNQIDNTNLTLKIKIQIQIRYWFRNPMIGLSPKTIHKKNKHYNK